MIMARTSSRAATRFAVVEKRSSSASAGRSSTRLQKTFHSRSFCTASITILPSPAVNGP